MSCDGAVSRVAQDHKRGVAMRKPVVVLIATLIALFVAAWTAFAQPTFSVLDLGENVNPYAISRDGTIAGSVIDPNEHLMIARGDLVSDLGAPGTFAIGYGVNTATMVGGYGDNPATGQPEAFTWTSGGGFKWLSNPPLSLHSIAFGITNAGTVAGSAYLVDSPGSIVGTWFPVRWVNGAPEVLAGGPGYVLAIDQTGRMGGAVGNEAVFWAPDGTLQDAGITGNTQALNDFGQALISTGPSTLLRWVNGVTTPLPFPSDGISISLYCDGAGMNNGGWIVGTCSRDPAIDGTESHAIVWTADNQPHDLNPLLTTAGYVVTNAWAVNDFGMIGGQALINGEEHGVVLVPSTLEKFPGLMVRLGLR
jgi:uncharacterized membrane protein